MAVPPPSTIALQKAGLRAKLRSARQAFAASRRFSPDKAALEKAYAAISKARCVAGYFAVGAEPDIQPLLEGAATHGVALALPRVDAGTGRIEFRIWHSDDTMDAWHAIPQPSSHAPLAAPDIILAPLVGFDRALNRLGQGGGYYDRAFAEHPEARRIGVAWSVQEAETVPTEPHDCKLHAVLTEIEWITQ